MSETSGGVGNETRPGFPEQKYVGLIKQPDLQPGELEYNLNRAEMVPWVYKENYRGKDVRVVEIDHIKTRELPENIDFPPQWRDALENQIMGTSGDLMLEYFVPELEETVYSGPILGGIAREKGEVEHVTPFFGYAAKICGREGRNVYSADPNITPGSFILQRINYLGGYWIPYRLKGKSYDDFHGAYYGKLHVKDLNGLENTISVDDARRLYTAHAMLSVALENPAQNKSVSLVTAPVHAERINYYIKRQKEFENKSGKLPQSPEGLKTMSPIEEMNKMRLYGVFMKPTLREYQPVLPRTAFELDILVNDQGRESYSDTSYQHNIFNIEHLDKIKKSIQTVLDDMSNQNQEAMTYRNRVKEVALPLIDKLSSDIEKGVELDPKELKKLEKSVSTHDIGWKNIRRSQIY